MSMSCNSLLLLFSSIFLTYFPGLIISADVTLSSIEIFTTHEFLKATPTVYFLCKGDNKTQLPDIKKPHVFYSFKGEESWQLEHLSHDLVGNHAFYSMFQWCVQFSRSIYKSCSNFFHYNCCYLLLFLGLVAFEYQRVSTALTKTFNHQDWQDFLAFLAATPWSGGNESIDDSCDFTTEDWNLESEKYPLELPLTNFSGKKCKRCGIYEEDKFLSDDVFDVWEFCPSDFTTPDGRYVHFKEKEFNASFLCPECLSFSGASVSAPPVENHNPNKKGMNVAVIILLSILGSTILILGMLGAYKYWQKRKREQDQARFLKLFEEGDDIEDELGLGTII
ncbi:hypothetical protein D0Y65_051794 [Glycine soja]|uniref:DUF7953 domain-containing protein n=1 Tax=Glycine soja TaxID=3848 RepID=A0A445FHU8_GLYSO|nr:hypothetical protein D0Y65_051794 [Glycine soja]